jgi:hypothetical protein
MTDEYPQPHEPSSRLTFPDLVKAVFTGFVDFADRYLREANPPLMYIAIWLIGMDTIAGGIELAYIYNEQYDVNNWFYAWIRILAAGALMGIFRYWMVGTIFHLVVVAAGGKRDARTSRYILLYALLPMAVCSLSIKIVQMLIYGNKYFIGQTNPAVEGMLGMVMLGAYVYTLILCYRGMQALQNTDKRRSIAMLVALSAGMIFLTLLGMEGP